jgi:hypothetical protein
MKNNDNNIITNNNNNDDDLKSIIGFKSPRYRRKVDFLVDEIINKCTRLNVRHNSIGGAISPDHMSDIPNTIGPHPLSSHLSLVLPSNESLSNTYDINKLKLWHQQIDNDDDDDDDDIENMSSSEANSKDFPKHSGNITHSEWFIEEKNDDNNVNEYHHIDKMNMDDDDDDVDHDDDDVTSYYIE